MRKILILGAMFYGLSSCYSPPKQITVKPEVQSAFQDRSLDIIMGELKDTPAVMFIPGDWYQHMPEDALYLVDRNPRDGIVSRQEAIDYVNSFRARYLHSQKQFSKEYFDQRYPVLQKTQEDKQLIRL